MLVVALTALESVILPINSRDNSAHVVAGKHENGRNGSTRNVGRSAWQTTVARNATDRREEHHLALLATTVATDDQADDRREERPGTPPSRGTPPGGSLGGMPRSTPQ